MAEENRLQGGRPSMTPLQLQPLQMTLKTVCRSLNVNQKPLLLPEHEQHAS